MYTLPWYATSHLSLHNLPTYSHSLTNHSSLCSFFCLSSFCLTFFIPRFNQAWLMIIPLHLPHACIHAMQLLSDFLISLLTSISVFKRCLSFSLPYHLLSYSHCILLLLHHVFWTFGFWWMDCFVAYLFVSVYHLRFVDLFLSSERASESFYLFFISIPQFRKIKKQSKASVGLV